MKIAALLCTLLVTNTNDEGSGSLRAAMEETIARGLQLCTIEFRIPGEDPWHTIRPRRPLPPVAFVTIDGTTQPDTNPDGPEIELNGSELSEGSGLHICGGIVRGLAINGFPANGITTGKGACRVAIAAGTIERNYIGTDPTGTRAVPNTRGIWLHEDQWNYRDPYVWRVEHNVVSGNRYSGIYAARGPHLIRRNIIGLTPKLDAGVGNGSSGVAVFQLAWGTDIHDNYIGFNGHFGVGVAPGTRSTAMIGNSFQANGQLAIDYGFDGPSPDGRKDIYPGIPAAPVITNVRYEREHGVTVIEGTTPYCPGIDAWTTVYANDAPDPSGYGEGQYWLGTVRGQPGFVVRHAGDLRGKWVAATFRCGFYYGVLPITTNGETEAYATTTSEFSRAVEVK